MNKINVLSLILHRFKYRVRLKLDSKFVDMSPLMLCIAKGDFCEMWHV